MYKIYIYIYTYTFDVCDDGMNPKLVGSQKKSWRNDSLTLEMMGPSGALGLRDDPHQFTEVSLLGG